VHIGSDSDSDSCRPKCVEAGACCYSSTEPITNPEGIGFSALHFHRLAPLRHGITRRYYSKSMGNAPPARPTPHARPEGIHHYIAEIELSSCIGLNDLPLLAVSGRSVAWVHSLIDFGTGYLASSNGSRPAGCCDSFVVCVAHTVESLRRRFAPCQC